MAIAMWWISLSLIVVAAAVAGVAWWRSRKRGQSGAIPVANSRRLTKLPAYRRALVRYSSLMTAVGVVLAILLAVTSVAAGRWVYQRVESPEKFNRDIVLCLDISGSMVDYDVEVLDRYLEMLPGFDGERMSLMLWDATAVQLFPLTDDYAFVETQLQQVRDEMESASGGSNIEYSFAQGTQGAAGASLVGDGLASCAMTFGDYDPAADDGRSRSIIFATDNAVNGDPLVSFPEAAEYTEQRGIKIYALDANQFEDAFADQFRTTILQSDGSYFKLTDPASVSGIVDQITSEQTSLMVGQPQLLITDRPNVWLMLMLAFVSIYVVLAWRLRL
ncbi:VWA domain-containing protein [Pseudoclavibacter helvolus]|uniref:VWFA domain-containing protein n=2 Tax=Pseudoclavibacter helvolus TaxID=255205 RepID=A0A7W4UM31_9MICO|nr:hypothetical protein [Pseudoclavibacter helvolus]